MSALPANVAVPIEGTRRSRRLAAHAPSHESSPASAAVATASYPSRRALRTGQVRPEQWEAPTTARELVARAKTEAGAAVAGTPQPTSHPTRRELRLAAQRPADACLDSVRPAAPPSLSESDFEVASVALTLSRLAVAATTFGRTVAPGEQGERDGQSTHDEQSRQSERLVVPPVPLASGGAGGGGSFALPTPAPISDGATPASPSIPAALRAWAPRVAVLSALGAVTVVTPLVAQHRTTEPATVAAPLAQASALDTLVATPATLDAAAAAEAPTAAADGGDTAAILASDSLAELRSSVSASRSEERSDIPQCGVPDEGASNGTLAALESTEYVSLSMPVQEGVYRLTSTFGPRWGSVHMGQDFAAPAGTPIHAIADGTVIYAGAGKEGRSGMLVIIEHEIDGQTVESWYVHMYPDGVFVQAGDVVKVGDVIGDVGSYGNSTGPHLHLEIHVGNVEDTVASAVDPLAWLQNHDATPVTSDVVCA